MEEVEISQQELDDLKGQVLHENLDVICEQLGDPGRYFASFKAKDLLSQSDCEEIKAEKLSVERVRILIEKVQTKRGRHNEHPYDVFIGALKRMRVHVHIVRILNTAFASKKAEFNSTKRVEMKMKDLTNGFPSNGGAVLSSDSPSPRTHHYTPGASTNIVREDSIVSKGPTFSNASSNSSPISSSSSSHGTTPPHLSSPQTDTDGSLISPAGPIPYPSRFSNNGLPVLPAGYNESGQKITTSRSDSQTTPISSEETDGVPTLPPGYNSLGQKVGDISQLVSDSKEAIHPSHGYMPADEGRPQNHSLPQRSHTSPDMEAVVAVNELKLLIDELRKDLAVSQDHVMRCEHEILRLRQKNEELVADNKRLNAAKNQYESYINILSGTSPGKSNGAGVASIPNTSKFGNWQGQGGHTHIKKRHSEQFVSSPGYVGTRYSSEANMLSIPTRPNKLPLNKMSGGNIRGGSNSQPNSYSIEQSPMYDSEMFYVPRHSPGSEGMSRDRGMPARMTSSGDDLTSGGEDKNSVRSFESGNSGNIMLTNQISTTETIV